MMDSTTKTTTAKPVSFPKSDVMQAFRATAENGSAQAKEAFENMTGATAETNPLIKYSFSRLLKVRSTTTPMSSNSLKPIPKRPSTSSKSCRA